MLSKTVFILVHCVVSIMGVNWQLLPGYIRHVSAKGKELWAATADFGFTMRWVDNGWTILTHGTRVAACNEKCGYMSLGFLNWFCDYNIAHKKWSCRNDYWIHSVSANDQYAIIVNHVGEIIKWQGTYTKLPAPGTVMQAAVGDKDEMWAIDSNANIQRWSGDKWTQIPGSGIYVDLQNATLVVLTDHNKNIYLWKGTEWKQIEGKECIQASINYESVFCVTPQYQLFKADLNTIEDEVKVKKEDA